MRQKKFIMIFALCALVLALLYVIFTFVIKDPLNTVYVLDKDGDVLDASIVFSNSDGNISQSLLEQLCASGQKGAYDVKKGQTDDIAYTFRARDVSISYRPFIYPEILLENIKEFTVTNENGSFTVYRDTNTDNFIIKGAERQTYNSSSLSNLIFQARFMLSLQKLENASKNLSDYGLASQDNPVCLSITDTDGKTNTVFIGKSIQSGFYMKHKDKPYIYIMDSSASVFFSSVNTFLAPYLTPAFEENKTNYAEKFTLSKNGSLFIDSNILPQDLQENSSSLHRITYPSDYAVNYMNYYNALSSMSQITGSAVLEYSVSSKPNKAELFSYFGFDTPSNQASITIEGKTYSFITGNTFTRDDIKYYYAYSDYLDIIVALEIQSVPFLSYSLIDFVSQNVFQVNIKDVQSIDITSSGTTRKFELSGDGDALTVTEKTSKRDIDTQSFRQMYISLLSVNIEGISDTTDISNLPLDLSFTVTKKNGNVTVYDFYTLSTTRTLIAVNGNFEFYTSGTSIEKIKENLSKLMRGETIQKDY